MEAETDKGFNKKHMIIAVNAQTEEDKKERVGKLNQVYLRLTHYFMSLIRVKPEQGMEVTVQ